VQPICTAGRWLRPLLTIWGEKILMAVVFTAAVIGLTQFASHVSRSGGGLESERIRDGHSVVGVEVRALWLPETLARLAKRQARAPLIRDRQELKQFLERQNLEDVCYVLSVRELYVNGEFDDSTYIRHPYEDIQHFPEFMEVLATAAGHPPRHTGQFEYDFATVSVQVVPDDYLKPDPRQCGIKRHRRTSPPDALKAAP
jgi:hypothetical protein